MVVALTTIDPVSLLPIASSPLPADMPAALALIFETASDSLSLMSESAVASGSEVAVALTEIRPRLSMVLPPPPASIPAAAAATVPVELAVGFPAKTSESVET